MLLAASGTPLNVHDQVQAVKAHLAGKKIAVLKPAMINSTQSFSATAMPPSVDVVSLAYSNGVPIQA